MAFGGFQLNEKVTVFLSFFPSHNFTGSLVCCAHNDDDDDFFFIAYPFYFSW
jgi:hypothetical protein